MKYTKAIVRKPGPNFHQGVTEAGLGQPDYDKAINQHERYCRALESCGLEVIRLEPNLEFPDSCFVEDTAIVINGAAAVARLGHVTRRGEESSVADALGKFKKLTPIVEPGTVDGGDVLRVGNHFFAGISPRSNEQGVSQLGEIVRSCGKTFSIITVDKAIHLKTHCSGLDDQTVLCTEGHLPPDRFKPAERVIEIPAEEHWAANCLSVNGFVVIPEGCPKTARKLESLGKTVITLDMSEYQKMDGRLTCLSILL